MAKKKRISIREQRMQEKEKKRSHFQEIEAKHQEEIRKLQEEKQRLEEEKLREEMEKTRHPVTQRNLSTEKKSSSKAAGLKSTLILNENELLMTAFGRGSQAVPEKYIVGKEVSTLPEIPNFTIRNDNDYYFEIDGRVKGAISDNPLHNYKRIGQDRISRDKLEMRYYGETFSDNIHIQIIYNILDIEKILSIHINNIVYTINNILRNKGEDLVDLVGYITLCGKYADLNKDKNKEIQAYFNDLCKAPQLAYYNIQIKGEDKQKADPNATQLTEEEFFSVIYTLGYMRQMLMHGNHKQNIYHTDSAKDKTFNHCLDTLNRLYNDRVKKLNSNFLNMAKKNLSMLFSAFGVEKPDEKAIYVRDYYDFVVRKQFKNMGFSIKCLREHMTDDIEEAFILRDQKYDSVRGKLYPFINFAIFRYYKENINEAERLVEKLRASMNEVEKDSIYKSEAVRIWPKMRGVILKHILPEMEGNLIKEKNISLDPDVSSSMLDSIMIGTDATLFTKIIFLATLFINGKETNDLITTLISKFDDICAFNAILHEQNLPYTFAKDFEFFNECEMVSGELRLVNSFAHMKQEDMNAKKIMYDEALTVLGISEEGKEEELRLMLDKDARRQNRQRAGLRNFIANNVIESDRFKYLVRYGNVHKLKGIAENKSVIGFVLKDIPDSQIVRYYRSITGDDNCDVQTMRKKLTKMITGFSFQDIADVEQNDRRSDPNAQEEKRQKQALVRLYLTALYLILKNLVYANSRYSLAFMILERDYKLETEDKDYTGLYADPVAFVKSLLSDRPYRKRVKEYMEQDFSNSDPWAIRAFRNKVEHLDAVRNADMYLGDVREFRSWYELYHYIIQRRIMDQFEYDSNKMSKYDGLPIITKERLNPKTVEYFELVDKHKTICKDFIKALNVPFAYNLPRFKNLTIGGLFDKNRREEAEKT